MRRGDFSLCIYNNFTSHWNDYDDDGVRLGIVFKHVFNASYSRLVSPVLYDGIVHDRGNHVLGIWRLSNLHHAASSALHRFFAKSLKGAK